MKVILVNGSPHKNGCTYTALCEVAKTIEESGIQTEIFQVEPDISGCRACGGCLKLGKCVIDDCVNTFVEKSKHADGFIFGTPVHYAAASAMLTSFMDRAFYSSRGSMKYKPAACVVSARRAGTTCAFEQINKYFSISQMPIISSNYWNMVHGSCPEDVAHDLEGLQTMRILGRNMAWFLKLREAGEKLGISLPEHEKKMYTNFIR